MRRVFEADFCLADLGFDDLDFSTAGFFTAGLFAADVDLSARLRGRAGVHVPSPVSSIANAGHIASSFASSALVIIAPKSFAVSNLNVLLSDGGSRKSWP